jgi:hypothetical protein
MRNFSSPSFFYSYFFLYCLLFLSSCIQVQVRPPVYGESGSKVEDHPQTHPYAQGPAHDRKESQNKEDWDWEVSRGLDLKLLENKIQGRHELDQYTRALPYFRNQREKIEFLSLEGFKRRQYWLQEKNFWNRIGEKEVQFSSLIKSQDVAVGMTSENLKKSWGEPREIFVSGLPQFGNSRWVYLKQVPTPDGYKTQKRIVYFEGGLVAGWDTQSP